MAASTTISHLGGGRYYVTITETNAGASDEVELTTVDNPASDRTKLPAKGRVLSQRCQLVSGTGTTVDPVLGRVTNPASNASYSIAENATAAASVINLADPPIVYSSTGNKLFHRSVPDAGSDNTIHTTYEIMEGWGLQK